MQFAEITALLVSVAYWPGLLSASVSPRWWVLWIGAPLALLLSADAGKMTASHWWGLAFLAYAMASLGWAISFEEGVSGLLQLIALALCFHLGSVLKDLRGIRLALGLGANVSAVFILLQIFGVDLLGHQPWQASKPSGLFINYDVCAEFGVVALVGVLGSRLWWLVPGALVCALIPASRGAMLALMLALPVLLGRRQQFLLWISVLLLAATVLAVDTELHPWRIDSMTGRINIWSWTVENMKVFGWGAGSYPIVFPEFDFAHNEPLHLFFELGVGSILFWVAILLPLRAPGAEIEKAIVMALLVEGLVGQPIHHAATAFALALCAGHLARLRARSLRAQLDSGDQRGKYPANGKGGDDLGAGSLRPASANGYAVPARPQYSSRA